MRRFRPWLAAFLIAIMTIMPLSGLAQSGPAVPAATEAPDPATLMAFLEAELQANLHELTEPRFPDVGAAHWARPQVERLYRRGVIDGKGDGRFDPEGNLTRAEALKLLMAALRVAEAPVFGGAPEGVAVPPGFVDPAHWVVTQGWFGDGIASGVLQVPDYPDGFGPDTAITRAEIARMLVRARAVAGPLLVAEAEAARAVLAATFVDAADVDPGMVRFLAGAVGRQYLKGFPDGTARPGALASRSQAAVFVERLLSDLQAIPASPPELRGAYDVWKPAPEPIDFAPVLSAIDGALAAEAEAESAWIAAHMAAGQAGTAVRSIQADVAVQSYQVSLAQDEVAGWNEYLGYPRGGWALWVGEQWATMPEGGEPEFPAQMEDPGLFAQWAKEQLTLADELLSGALGGLEEIQAQQAAAEAAAEEAAGGAAMADGQVSQASTRTRKQLGELESWARIALDRGDCEEIRRLYNELLQRLQVLQAELQLRQARLQQAKADFDAADQAAKTAEAAANDLEAKAQKALEDMQSAADELQNWYRQHFNIPGVSFGPGAPAGWNYAGVSVHGVTLREVWFENDQAASEYLTQTENAHKDPDVQAIRQKFNAARDAYRQAMKDLPGAKAAAKATRATADGKEAAMDAAEVQVNITKAEIDAVQAQLDLLESLYQQCLSRRAEAEKIGQKADEARRHVQQQLDQVDQALAEARQARNAVADGLRGGGGPCPEAEELLRRANEAAARAGALRDRMAQKQRQLDAQLQQAQSAARHGETDLQKATQAAQPLIDEINSLAQQAEDAAREAKRLADEAKQALDRCKQQREDEGNPPGREIPDDEAKELADAIDELNQTNDEREKAEQAGKILEKLADWYASGKTPPDWLNKRVGLGGTAAGGVIDIGLTLIKAGPCPWLAIMVARSRALWIENAGTPREGYYFLLWQRFASYYAQNCAERNRPPR